jgi:Ser/Thr protein kinase RdoA (MazF antagonist)
MLVPKEVLQAYANLGEIIEIMPINIGLINKTFLVKTNHNSYILQRVSSIFSEMVNEDFYHVASYLETKNVLAPQILLTNNKKLFVNFENAVFRAQTYIKGACFNKITSENMAFNAGMVLGKFHFALKDFNYEYKNKRKAASDYIFHKNNLQLALIKHTNHDYYPQSFELAKKMFVQIDVLLPLINFSKRHVHGDPKISNILFDEAGIALCLVDFDTLSDFGWSAELGDALRSWSNPKLEDELDAYCDLELISSSLNGYSSFMKGQLTDCEQKQILLNTKAITLCLAMRYLSDVLNENYFSYDNLKFSRAAQHNWLRANAMYTLFCDIKKKSADISQLINVALH